MFSNKKIKYQNIFCWNRIDLSEAAPRGIQLMLIYISNIDMPLQNSIAAKANKNREVVAANGLLL